MSKPPYLVLLQALARARRWERRDYVVGTAIGQRQRAHDYLPASSELCVVVFVDRKLLPDALQYSRRRKFPSTIEVRAGRRVHRVPVDVQETGAVRVGELHGLVASAVSISGRPAGAVGALVARDTGERLTLIAGHVAKHAGRHLQLSSGLTVVVTTVRMTNLLDHALARPAGDGPGCAALVTGEALTGIRAIDRGLVGRDAFFHHAATGTRVLTVVRAVDASAPFRLPNRVAPVWMRGLVATDRQSMRGDSGTLLYDAKFRAIGTLVGALGDKSFFVPCDTAFARLHLTLIGD